MNWYMQSGKDSDVVILSKIKYSRNLRNYNFATENEQELLEIENLVKSNLPSIGYNLKFLRLKDMDDLTKKSLYEKGLIDEEALKNSKDKTSILVNDEENICIMINANNHIEIQVFGAGMELENTFKYAKEIDGVFENTFDIAKSKKYGYLTTSPINVGTGLNAEIIVHLPGLTQTGNIRKIAQTVNNFGLSFTGLYVNNDKIIGDIYKITNKQTLGVTEETIINNLRAITDRIIEQERTARKLLAKNQIELEDMLYRKYRNICKCQKIKMGRSN